MDTSTCIKKCNGMIITSFQKSLEKYDPMEIKAYNKYKKIFKSTASSSIKGNSENHASADLFILKKDTHGKIGLDLSEFILTPQHLTQSLRIELQNL